MASSSGSSRFSETTTTRSCSGIGPLQLPGHGGGVRRDFVGARLRTHAIALDVALEADALHRVGVRILIVQVRTLLRVGLEEDDLARRSPRPCGWLR